MRFSAGGRGNRPWAERAESARIVVMALRKTRSGVSGAGGGEAENIPMESDIEKTDEEKEGKRG